MADPKYRDVITVINKILGSIPENQTGLIAELETYRNEQLNQAPEIRVTSHCWIPLQHILLKNITELNDEWKENVCKIYNGTDK